MGIKRICAAVAAFAALAAGTDWQPVRVACVGDSITEGFGLKPQSRKSYPARLAELLGPTYEVMNFGRSSTTMMEGGNFPYQTAKEYSNALKYAADIYIVMLGTNDAKLTQWDADKYETSYQNFVDTLRSSHPGAAIYLCLPIPVRETRWEITDSVVRHGVLPVVRRVAERNGLQLIDNYALLDTARHLIADKIHPNDRGAQLIAENVARAIRK